MPLGGLRRAAHGVIWRVLAVVLPLIVLIGLGLKQAPPTDVAPLDSATIIRRRGVSDFTCKFIVPAGGLGERDL